MTAALFRAAKTPALLAAFVLLLSFLLHGTTEAKADAVSQNSPARTTDALAVLGIEDRRGDGPGDTGLMAGLTDVLSFSLQQRGARMVDRQTIARVFGERRLNRLLGNVNAPLSSHALPEATFTVQGVLTRQVPSAEPAEASADGADHKQPTGLLLTLELYRTLDGSLLQRVTMPAATETQLAELVDLAAGAIDLKLIATATMPPFVASDRLKGLTENPEAALMFYRGLEHLAANRNTMAAAYFSIALRHDWRFTVASVWLYRSLQRAGFDNFAEAILLKSDQHQDGELRKRISSTRQILGNGRLVIAVASSQETRQIASNLEQSWASDQRLSVLTSNGVLGATSEQDLKLSGEFEHLPAVIDRWLFADVFVRITPKHAVAYDVKTGQEVARRELAQAADSQWLDQAQWPKAGQADATASVTHKALASQVTADPLNTNFYKQAMLHAANKDAQGAGFYEMGEAIKIAAYLDRVIHEPGNITAWFGVAQLDYQWCNASSNEMILRLIDKHRDLPDAAAWVSAVCGDRFENLFHRPPLFYYSAMLLCETETPIAEQYKELLEWYPDSTPAQLVHYAMSLELYDQGKPDQAIEMLRQLALKLPSLRWPDDTPMNDNAAPNIYYELANMYCQQNDVVEARRWHEACKQAIEKVKYKYSLTYTRDLNIFSYKHQVTWTFAGAKGYSHRDALMRMFIANTNLTTRVREMEIHLAKAEAGQQKLSDYKTFTDLHAAVLRETDDDKRFDMQLQSVMQWLDTRVKSDGEVAKTLQLRQIAWLRLFANTPRRHAQVDAVIRKALGDTYDMDKTHVFMDEERQTLMLLADRYDIVVASKIRTQRSERPIDAVYVILYLISIESLELPPAAQSKRILELVAGFEKKYPDLVKEGSAAYYNLLVQCAPFLIARGEIDQAVAFYQRIIDDPKVPWLYHDGAKLQQALAVWRSGKPEEATLMLRSVAEDVVSKATARNTWQQDSEHSQALHAFRYTLAQTSEKLMTSCNESLHRLRLFGGRTSAGKPATDYQQQITYDPLPQMPHARSKLYAMAYLMAVSSYYFDFSGNNWWGIEAGRALVDMGEDGLPFLQRMLWYIHTENGANFGHRLDVNWQTSQYVTALSKDHQVPEAMLLDWLAWSPVCEIKQLAARCLDAKGVRSPQAVTTLVLASAMNDGCQVAARATLMKIGRLDLPAATAAAELLDHPASEVRTYAAIALANGVGFKIDDLNEGMPSEQAIASLRQWWQSTKGDPAKWPESPTGVFISAAQFNSDASRWVTWGSGSQATVYQNNAQPIVLNHGQSRSIRTATISGDGKVVATFAQDHQIRVWDLNKPETPRLIIPTFTRPWELALDHHGKQLAYSRVRTLYIRNVSTGQITHELNHFADGDGFKFLGEQGNEIFAAVATFASPTRYDLIHHRIIDTTLGTKTGFWLSYPLSEGRILTRGYDSTMRIWNTQPKLSSMRLPGYFDWYSIIAPAADSRRIAGIDGHKNLLIWDAHTGQLLENLGKVSESTIAIGWPEDSGPMLIRSNRTIQRFSSDLKTSTMTSLEVTAKALKTNEPNKPDGQHTVANIHHTTGDDACCQLIVRR